MHTNAGEHVPVFVEARAQLSGVRSLLHSGARELKFEDSRINALNSQHIILKKEKVCIYYVCMCFCTRAHIPQDMYAVRRTTCGSW